MGTWEDHHIYYCHGIGTATKSQQIGYGTVHLHSPCNPQWVPLRMQVRHTLSVLRIAHLQKSGFSGSPKHTTDSINKW